MSRALKIRWGFTVTAAQDQEMHVEQAQPACKDTHHCLQHVQPRVWTRTGCRSWTARLMSVETRGQMFRTSEALVPPTGVQQKSFISRCSKCAAQKNRQINSGSDVQKFWLLFLGDTMIPAVIQSNRDEMLFCIFKQGGHDYFWMFARTRVHVCGCADVHSSASVWLFLPPQSISGVTTDSSRDEIILHQSAGEGKLTFSCSDSKSNYSQILHLAISGTAIKTNWFHQQEWESLMWMHMKMTSVIHYRECYNS